jgi:hypothetical protein
MINDDVLIDGISDSMKANHISSQVFFKFIPSIMRFFSLNKLCLPRRFGPLFFDLRCGLINAPVLTSFGIITV